MVTESVDISVMALWFLCGDCAWWVYRQGREYTGQSWFIVRMVELTFSASDCKHSTAAVSNMESEETPPTKEQIDTVIEGVKAKVEDEGDELFYLKDLEHLSSSDEYVTRFWIHTFFMPGNRFENTINMVVNTFKWRKEFGVRALTEKLLDEKIKEKGALFSRNRDKNGSKILIFCIRKHVKDPKNMQSLKEFFVYMLDRLEREENGKKITIIFDCENATLANFDIEIVRFIIQVLICFFPNFVSKILVYQMPWILNAAWKIVKTMLPAPAVARIVFVTKSSIEQLVSPEWGSLDTWDFSWIEERESQEQVKEVESINDDSEVKLSPEKLLIFSKKDNNNLEADIVIMNMSSSCLAYKVKSTSPSLFLVRPHTATISPGEKVVVKIQTSAAHDSLHSRIPGQQFQINYLTTMETNQDKDTLAMLFSKKTTTVNSRILSCGLEKGINTMETVSTSRVLSDRVIFLEEKLNYLQQILVCQALVVVVYLAYRWLCSGYNVLVDEGEG